MFPIKTVVDEDREFRVIAALRRPSEIGLLYAIHGLNKAKLSRQSAKDAKGAKGKEISGHRNFRQWGGGFCDMSTP